MASFVARKLLEAAFVLLTVGVVAFVLFAYIGDPISMMLGQNYTDADRERIVKQLGLDQPQLVQFAKFVGRAVQGDFGMSYQHGRPVGALMLERLPATIELGLASTLIALAMGIPIGVYSALRPRSWLSHGLLNGSLVGVSVPSFLLGIWLITIFAVQLGWVPSFDRGQTVAIGWWTTGFLTTSGLRSLILPVITLALLQLTLTVRLVRSEMLEVLGTDYIRFAHARGLSHWTINFRHALKNTLLPVVTITGLQFGQVIAFSIVTETVFQWPGLGMLFIQAVLFADVPVMAAYLSVVSLMLVTISLIVDFVYLVIDPRLRAERSDVRNLAV